MGLLFMIGSSLECGDIGWVIGQLTSIQVGFPAYQFCFLDMPLRYFILSRTPLFCKRILDSCFWKKLVTIQFLLQWRMPFLQRGVRIANFRFRAGKKAPKRSTGPLIGGLAELPDLSVFPRNR
jgi:hypothetical protein